MQEACLDWQTGRREPVVTISGEAFPPWRTGTTPACGSVSQHRPKSTAGREGRFGDRQGLCGQQHRLRLLTSVSDPVQNAALPAKVQGDWGSVVYDAYGFYTSCNGALAAWAVLVGAGGS